MGVSKTSAAHALICGRVASIRRQREEAVCVLTTKAESCYITGQTYTPTGSVLALIGISAGTGLAGAIVDRDKYAGVTGKRTELEVEQAALTNRIRDGRRTTAQFLIDQRP